METENKKENDSSMKIEKGTKIIAKFLDRISKDSEINNGNFSYNDEHMQEHHDDWTWSDH
jgi:hypothetical protein